MNFYRHVAQHILSCHPPPDLRGAIVLLPNYHAAQPLIRALNEAAGLPALLLPEMTTFADWAGTVPLDCEVQPDTSRISALYGALRERNWFPDANLWSLSCDLLDLMDELTRHRVELPRSAAEFSEQLAKAYQARSGQAMQFEARVVHELWYAMASGGGLDAASAYQQRLAGLHVDRPLYVLTASDMSMPEMRFLKTCREQVTVFDLREMAADAPECALLAHALQQTSEDLRSAALLLKEQAALPLRLFGAHSLEQEARAAELQVRRWLLEGKQNIALVAQDRLVARRVRALLERAGVLVCDETGWTMSTLAVSTVLMRWLDALQSDFYYLDLLDLLKSPFIFSDQSAALRKQAVYQIEQMVRKHGVASRLDAFLDMARGNTEAGTALARLRQAARALQKTEGRRQKPISIWLQALHESLEMLGVIEGWRQDGAGQQLLQLLELWHEELQGDTAAYSFAEWRRWLAHQLDRHTFRDAAMESPVLLTHLAATRWRSFDAVLLLGADAAHLPAMDKGSLWFNDAVRRALGLPTSETRLAQERDDLFSLLAMNGTLLATWQASKNGEPNLLSPYLEMLRAQHRLLFGHDLMDRELGGMIEFAQVRVPEDRGQRTEDRGPVGLPLLAEMPRPAVPNNLIPSRISPSGYNSLVACPYQYFARHVLHLNELDEVREDVEKRDYGEWVHLILHRFHEEFPVLEGRERDELKLALERIGSEVFAPAVARDFLARAWLLRWQQAIPAYLDFQLESEARGWRYREGEMQFDLNLADDLTLHGRIDRIDATREGVKRVLDYKTTGATGLRNRLKEAGEDVQLACYAIAEGAVEAAFISIEKEKVVAVASPHDVSLLARANVERLSALFAQMRQGAALPAHGADEACEYCEMRGLCRKGSWDAREVQEGTDG